MQLGSLVNLLAIIAMTSMARADPQPASFDGSHFQVSVAADAPALIGIEGPDLVPILWRRGDAHEARLPALLLPGAGEETVIHVGEHSQTIMTTACPRVTIDSRAYDRLVNWRQTATTDQRRTTLLLAGAFTASFLLASLLKRGRVVAFVVILAAWSGGLVIAASKRPTLLRRDEADGSRWFLATVGQTIRVPIGANETWVPIVESVQHLKALSPRIDVDGDTATLELTLPSGAKVGFRLSS